MISATLLLLVLGSAAWAWRTGPRESREPVFATCVRLAVLLALQHAVALAASAPFGAGLLALLVPLRALLALAAWVHVAWLGAWGVRTRSRWVRLAFAALALIVALTSRSWTAFALMILPATLSYGWRRALDTRRLFAVSLIPVALLVFALWRIDGLHAPETTGALGDLWNFGRFVETTGLLYVGMGVFKTLAAFVRDPSLGIRAVRRRLALSHLLVGLVPALLLAAMWLLTTWLGVTADRALTAERAVEAEANGLRSALAQALATPGEPALDALATAHRDIWPGLRLWRIDSAGATRVAGDSVALERALPAWSASGDSLPRTGIVELAGRRWLGATARDSLRGVAAIALVPIEQALSPAALPPLDARLWMSRQVAPPDSSAGDSDEGDADSDTNLVIRRGAPAHPAPHAHSQPRQQRNKAHVQLTAGRDTLELDDAAADSASGAGLAVVRGITWHGRWKHGSFRLAVSTTFGSTVSGLWRSVRANPYNVIPLAILVGLGLLLLPVALFNLTMVRQLARSFLAPVGALREGTQALADARLDYRIPLQGDDELWDAAGAFNRMSDGLARARELEKERDRLEHELELARRIQQRLLPAAPPAIAGLEIAGTSEPAREVGGDYYDHIPLGDDRVMLVIADVSGKGVPAALLMSAFRASLMSQDAAHSEPSQVAERLNAFLHRSVDPGKFVTAFVGFLDGRSGRLIYANAGHNPPLVRRRDGSVEWLAAGGLILGILAETRFESGEVVLAPGELLVLYTDGVTEGADARSEQFGEERLVAAVDRLAAEPCVAIAAALVRDVRAFEGESGPADDITVLVARRARA